MTLSWNRRLFLKAIALSAGGAALGIGTGACRDSTDGASSRPADLPPLTRADLDELVLLGVALFEPEDDREKRELDTTIRWWASGRTSHGPHLELYRNGLAALATASRTASGGRAFANLTPTERSAIVAAPPGSDALEPLHPLRNELLEAIYSTGIGWKSLGYTTWPGIPSAPLEYTTRPHGPTRIVLTTPLSEILG